MRRAAGISDRHPASGTPEISETTPMRPEGRERS